jgi:hypothetical protein
LPADPKASTAKYLLNKNLEHIFALDSARAHSVQNCYFKPIAIGSFDMGATQGAGSAIPAQQALFVKAMVTRQYHKSGATAQTDGAFLHFIY